jgi:methylenetetrahydrofolate--tRNA-(uracil-5-)-methyltransferase
VRFAGQITGVEGYVESIASGLLVGWMVAARRLGRDFTLPPVTTTLGALHAHTLGTRRALEEGKAAKHLPSNIHWGLLPPLAEPPAGKKRDGKRDRKRLYGERALADLDAWLRTAAI